MSIVNVNTTKIWYDIEDELDDIGTPQAVLLIVVGMILLSIGKKCMPLGIFFASFLGCAYAAFAAFVFFGDQGNLSDKAIAYGALGTGLFCGIIGGILALKIVSWGFFLFGFACGCSFGMYAQHLVLAGIFASYTAPDYVPYVVVIALGLVGGYCMVKLKGTIFACLSSFLGAFCVTQGWVYFAHYPTIPDIVNGDQSTISEKVWTEIAVLSALTILGTIYQTGYCRRTSSAEREKTEPLISSDSPFFV